MSQENRNDMGADWGDMDTDWLNDLPGKEPEVEAEPTFRFGEQIPEGGHEPRPTETARRPESAEPDTEVDWEAVKAAVRKEKAAADRADRKDRIRPGDYEPYEREVRARKPKTAVREEPADLDDLEEVLAGNRRKTTSLPLIIVIAVLVMGMIFAGWQLGSIFMNYHRDRSAYNDLAANAISALAEGDVSGTEQSAEGEITNVRVVSEVPIQVDWDYLRSVNSSVVGWLYCADTVINYPVVQSTDHQFYLNHGFDKTSNTSGTLFADMDSVAGVTLSNYIIYGHNMKDNSMFGTFKEYVNESYYREHPTLYYLTPQGSYRVQLFGCHMVEGTTDNFPTYFSDTTDYQRYLDSISGSFYWFERDKADTRYQLITLSTCTSGGGFDDARLLLHGVMIPVQ